MEVDHPNQNASLRVNYDRSGRPWWRKPFPALRYERRALTTWILRLMVVMKKNLNGTPVFNSQDPTWLSVSPWAEVGGKRIKQHRTVNKEQEGGYQTDLRMLSWECEGT